MIRLLLPVAVIVIVILVGLLWATINDRFVKLEQEIEELRTELLFLRGELDLTQQRIDEE
jgi:nitrogen fixation-related uncharacterized protein